MDTNEFAESIFLNLPYDPTNQQVKLIAALAHFCRRPAMGHDDVFLLCGYAGTGKTSVVGALVQSLTEAGVPAVVMAPTGRAAKVFSSYSGFPATTIHRRIYRHSSVMEVSGYDSEIADNPLIDGVFIVDEASMIGGEGVGADNLLADLIQYVYSGSGCRLILLGDTAQLPPVGCDESPAMEPDVLRSYGLRVTRAVLTATVRQQSSSGVLYNATRLRRLMRRDELPPLEIFTDGFDDIRSVPPVELPEELGSDYSTLGVDSVLLITRSNRRAVQYNLAIRHTILEYDMEGEITAGERLLVAKNNYLWSAKVKGLDFIANGDVLTVNRIYGYERRYGLRFADVAVGLVDSPQIEFDCKVLLDTLTSEAAALEPKKYQRLYADIIYDSELFTDATPLRARQKIVHRDPYLNALQVKYAYAVTCHKAQGGQWESVYVDMGGIVPDTATSLEMYRWLYTALTRTTDRMTLIGERDAE